MGGARASPSYAVRVRVERQLQRLGTDARIARVGNGMSQATIARRAGVSQATVARLEAGDVGATISTLVAVFSALGMELSLRAYPGPGIPLRDSGQVALASVIQAAAHPNWRVRLEAPVGDQSGRAADMLLIDRSHGLHIEVETALVDFQAQVRSAQLKRDQLERKVGHRLALVIALGDSKRNRHAVSASSDVVRSALPATAREVMSAVRGGLPLHRDGLLWVRQARNSSHSPGG